MRFAIFDHGSKALYLRQTLETAGHTPAQTLQEADLVLLDCDWHWAHPRPELIQEAATHGAKIALYPHGGQPTTFIYDGLTTPDERVDVRLEHGPGSIDIADLLGLPLRQKAPGWLYCPTTKFAPVDEPRKVLFAPQHPNIEALQKGTNGHDPGPHLNQHVYRQLLNLGYEITVSLVGPAWRNGVWAHPKARFVENHEMLFPPSFALIHDADVVVAAGTVGAAGVACGKPTVMLATGDCSDYVDGRYMEAENASLYADQLRYPLDAADADLDGLIERACAGDKAAAEWRARFVGDDGCEAAVKLLEELVPVPETTNATIQGVTAKAGARAN